MSPLPIPRDLMDVNSAARLLGAHVSAVYRWIAARKMTAYRVGGRWKLSRLDVEGFVRRTGPEEERPGPRAARPPSEAEARELLRRAGMLPDRAG